MWLLAATRLAPREKGGDAGERRHIRVSPAVLMVGGALHAAFIFSIIRRM